MEKSTSDSQKNPHFMLFAKGKLFKLERSQKAYPITQQGILHFWIHIKFLMGLSFV